MYDLLWSQYYAPEARPLRLRHEICIGEYITPLASVAALECMPAIRTRSDNSHTPESTHYLTVDGAADRVNIDGTLLRLPNTPRQILGI